MGELENVHIYILSKIKLEIIRSSCSNQFLWYLYSTSDSIFCELENQ